jgi:hypothetical protein
LDFSPIADHHPDAITLQTTKLALSARKCFHPPDHMFPNLFALPRYWILLDKDPISYYLLTFYQHGELIA